MGRSAVAERRTTSTRTSFLPFDRPGRGATHDEDPKHGAAQVVPTLVHRLPSAEDTRDALSSAAQKALDRARDVIGSAREQMSDVSLPESLQNVQLPRRKQRRRGPSRLVILALVGGLAVAAFLAYRWFGGHAEADDAELYAENWPAQPSNTPGAGGEPREDDKTASIDAEQSQAVRSQNGAPIGVNQP